MSIVLDNSSIKKINLLVNLCPNTFTYVPFKIFKDEEGNSFASIETIDINGSTLFSGRVAIENVSELDAGTGIIIRLPLSKQITDTIFSDEFTTLDVSKQRIIAKNQKKKITIALYDMSDDNILEFPYLNNEILDLTLKENGLSSVDYEQFDLTTDEIKEISDSIGILNNPENVFLNSNGKNIMVSSGDYSGNDIELKVDKPVTHKFSSKFDTSMIKVLSKFSKYKDSINVILCELLIAFTINDENVVATIGVPAAKD